MYQFSSILGTKPMCDDCLKPVANAIEKCSYDEECLSNETGYCFSCMCTIVAQLKLDFLNSICSDSENWNKWDLLFLSFCLKRRLSKFECI